MFSRVASSAVLLVFVLPWTAITGAADYFAISSMARQVQSANWPSVQGTLIRSEVEAVRSNKSTTYGLKVAYTYSVDGQRYEGSRYRFAAWRSGDAGYAEELVVRYPLGTSIPVYYRPGQPSEAVLQAGLGSSELFLLMVLLPFNLVALWLGAMVGWAWKPEPPLLSTFFREDGSECVTLDEQWTAAWVFLAMGSSALACVVLGGLAGGFNAPLPVGVGAWGAVIACGVLAGLWSRARRKAGHYDLRLHTQTRSLSLPPFSGRKHRLDVRWRDVRSLRVEPQVRTPQGQVTRYHLTLERALSGGGVSQEAIASFIRQEQAEALARWLRTHLKVGEAAPGEQRSA
ncbi:Protein of unknown function [Stigmatella aurantiaca]|uniref:DUF3592 domain-containing protein n=1 Tax=Stigmatella aurantiaca TaxID=41 RepID=A0A1H7GJ13_STIAU|nr:DUF3592 domain-containing protein [Stigmatella aurantiaca]SEK38054.1 Protein of unknown function [Stigmatella aurantiaca]